MLVSGGPTTDTHTSDFDIWTAPAVIVDPVTGGEVAVVACVPAFTGDGPPGPGPFDFITAEFLGQGLELVTELTFAALGALPVLSEWTWRLGTDGNEVHIDRPGGVFYEGDLGADAPPGWCDTPARQDSLVLLVACDVDLFEPDQAHKFDYTRRSGIVVGARIPRP